MTQERKFYYLPYLAWKMVMILQNKCGISILVHFCKTFTIFINLVLIIYDLKKNPKEKSSHDQIWVI